MLVFALPPYSAFQVVSAAAAVDNSAASSRTAAFVAAAAAAAAAAATVLGKSVLDTGVASAGSCWTLRHHQIDSHMSGTKVALLSDGARFNRHWALNGPLLIGGHDQGRK